MGCTHFPLLRAVIAAAVGPDVTLIDCGIAASTLIAGDNAAQPQSAARIHCLVTDAVERFTPHIGRFLGIDPAHLSIEHIDLTDILNTDLRKAS